MMLGDGDDERRRGGGSLVVEVIWFIEIPGH
jgi:hypothetical protein